ncbi:MAG: hypothetical protein KJZ74_09675 [Gemmatimonadales bacterium]|nr:hypothetical protein [Gemmatimonadota bacterium]MCL4214174.1 hypothetical protein [Gemmatimonadales bacterium]
MLRTIFMIGLIAFAGLFVLKLFFGILGGVFGILFLLLRLAIPIAIVGGLIYLVLRVFAPDTAKDLRSKFGGD